MILHFANNDGFSETDPELMFTRHYISPYLGDLNTLHHMDASVLQGNELDHPPSLRPFPACNYRGYVGQATQCSCDVGVFADTGCVHVQRMTTTSPAERITELPNIMAQLAAFMGH